MTHNLHITYTQLTHIQGSDYLNCKLQNCSSYIYYCGSHELMISLMGFCVKVGLFMALVFLPWKTRYESSFVNINLSCIQIVIVSVVYVFYHTSVHIFESIRKQRYSNVDFDEGSLDEIYLGDLEDFDPDERQKDEQASSTRAETRSVQTESVQLANFTYVLQTHVLGMVVFLTFLFIDANNRVATNNFIFGLITGHMLYFMYLRVFVSFTPNQHIPLMVCNILSLTLILIISQKFVIPDDFIESKSFFANLCVSLLFPFLSGFMWGFYYSRPHVAASVLDTAKNSIVTIWLLCGPMCVMIDPTQFPEFVGVSVLFYFIIDPLVKFFCVQLILLSVESMKSLELIIILLISAVLDYRFNYQVNSVASVAIVSCLCLVYASIVIIDHFKSSKKSKEIVVFERSEVEE